MLLLYRGEDFDSNFYYHSGADIDHSFFLQDGKKRILFVPKLNESIARSSFKGRVVVYQDMKALSKYLKGKVRFDGGSISARMAGKLRKLCKLEDHTGELLRMRSRKRPDEVSAIRKAVKATKEVFDSLDLSAKTEEDLKKQILHMTLDMGLEPAFDPIVAAGKSSSFPHYTPGKKKLKGVVLVDYGVRYRHYCADLTRCFILDNDQKKKAQYEELQNICMTVVDSLPNCKNGSDVGKLSEKLMGWAGLPEMIHSIGHGVGLDVHEPPSFGKKSKDPLDRCTMAIEPAFYLKSYGMRYEETVYFDGKKARVL